MRSFIILLALAVATFAVAIPKHVESGVVQPQQLAVLDGVLCDLCKDLVKDAENSGEGDLKGWLDKEIGKVCKHLGFLAKECNKILDGLVDKLVDLINQHLDATTICTKVDLC